MAPINTCLLGTGLSGLTFQVPFILALPDLFSLHAVLERNPKSQGGKVKDRFGVTTKVYKTLEEVLADTDIELVIVSTPNATHHEFTKRSLEAGKHVLVEKPVAATATEARQLGELAKSKNLVLYSYNNRRWDSDFLALKRLLNQPATEPVNLGELVEFETHYDRFRLGLKGTWKDEKLPAAGLLYDLGVHLIDQVVSLFGKPQKVTGFAENVRGVGHPEVDDVFTVILRYPISGERKYPLNVIVRGHMISVRDPQLRYVVRGTNGTFVKYGVDVQEDQLRGMPAPQNIFSAGYGKEPESIWGVVEVRDETGKVSKHQQATKLNTIVYGTDAYSYRWPSTDPGSYVELFKNLAGAIRTGEELKVKWDEATTVLQIIEAAHQSSKEERTVTLG